MKSFSSMFFLIIMLILAIFMMINPRETVQASAMGFELWYRILVPALLPFFIVADLLVSLHFVGLLGSLLEPVMRPLFRLPGCSALVVVMGYTSGFPVGAVLSRRLYEEGLLGPQETERLVAFTNNSSPLFIIGAIGVGMFDSAAAGYLLAVSHYAANLLVGFYWGHTTGTSLNKTAVTPRIALKKMWREMSEDTAGLGSLLGNAVRVSINNLLAIAGFIILFSVLTRMFTVWGILDILVVLAQQLLGWLGFSYQVLLGMGMGLFEVTLGSKTIAAAADALPVKLMAVTLILAFSGFSIIAQVMSIVAGLPVRLSFYLKSRVMQMGLASLITWFGYTFILLPRQSIPSAAISVHKILYAFDAWHLAIYSLFAGVLIIAVLMMISLCLRLKNPVNP